MMEGDPGQNRDVDVGDNESYLRPPDEVTGEMDKSPNIQGANDDGDGSSPCMSFADFGSPSSSPPLELENSIQCQVVEEGPSTSSGIIVIPKKKKSPGGGKTPKCKSSAPRHSSSKPKSGTGGSNKSEEKQLKLAKAKIGIPEILIPDQLGQVASGVWVVQKVVDRRVVDGKLQYMVKWANWPRSSNTWEPIEHLAGCSLLVKKLDKKLNRAQLGKVSPNKKRVKGTKKLGKSTVCRNLFGGKDMGGSNTSGNMDGGQKNPKAIASSSASKSKGRSKPAEDTDTDDEDASDSSSSDDSKDSDPGEDDVLEKMKDLFRPGVDRHPERWEQPPDAIVGVTKDVHGLVYLVRMHPDAKTRKEEGGGEVCGVEDGFKAVDAKAFNAAFPQIVIQSYESQMKLVDDTRDEGDIAKKAARALTAHTDKMNKKVQATTEPTPGTSTSTTTTTNTPWTMNAPEFEDADSSATGSEDEYVTDVEI